MAARRGSRRPAIGFFFVAGVGDVNRDGTPDVYAGDFYHQRNGVQAGAAHVFSGRDGKRLHTFLGATAGEGMGPGRGTGDVNRDGYADAIVGSYTSSAGAPQAGRVDLFPGRDGCVLRSWVSVRAGENLGFDAVGIGDVNRDGRIDFVLSAATGDTIYIVAGYR